ncbi:SET and MYND domain-containing protein, putative [Pediculus humanus corporis]|uniref:SET and MYND domain-containing protein, putative n=1 Tax=Pediculus humanus subsp. corporis TaxID=121224 RepID=E0VD53_PEDHC|nr:SET and MYND domain-containing protein, putative [Pediculus humanus corporis]EEB11309.1 SET and MYND domain-containing protein, putative [Pediculus humanus corporis]
MQMHFPPASTTALIFVKIFAIIHQYENKEFCHETSNKNENITHKLLGIKFSDQVETLRQLIKASVPTEHAEEWITPEGFSQLLVLVGMNGQGIGTSSFSEWVKNVSKAELPLKEKQLIDNYIDAVYENFEKGVGDFLNNEGSGLYELQSTINHSCSPNAEVTFPHSNYQLAVVATDNINPGDEICISYLDMCSLSRSRHSRQKILQENYLFTCKCHKCEEEVNLPDETSSDESMDS